MINNHHPFGFFHICVVDFINALMILPFLENAFCMTPVLFLQYRAVPGHVWGTKGLDEREA